MTAGLESESSGSDEDSSGQGDLRAYMRQQLEVPKSHDIKEQDQQRETDATSDEDSNNDVTDSGKPLNSKARERRLNRKKRSRSVRFAFDEVETVSELANEMLPLHMNIFLKLLLTVLKIFQPSIAVTLFHWMKNAAIVLLHHQC